MKTLMKVQQHHDYVKYEQNNEHVDEQFLIMQQQLLKQHLIKHGMF
jgi:hypothetical protein